ncbi:MAG: hemerythrin domain-containing protein [Hyphomicrobiales bacterium]|nr:hemerythrin domain-containing protein [Hyphomicrobiales bacterium]MCP5374059.1 hemerythrin domain-containing protein [Hyphomicrobiales bacterium]
MSELVEELKREHAALFALLDEIAALGVETAAGRARLMDARDLFVAHLRKEDRHVHPVIAAEEAHDPELHEIMDLMDCNLRDVTHCVENFFTKHAGGGHADTFAGDFELISAMLHNRMRREEKVLLREYEKLVDGAADGHGDDR